MIWGLLQEGRHFHLFHLSLKESLISFSKDSDNFVESPTLLYNMTAKPYKKTHHLTLQKYWQSLSIVVYRRFAVNIKNVVCWKSASLTSGKQWGCTLNTSLDDEGVNIDGHRCLFWYMKNEWKHGLLLYFWHFADVVVYDNELFMWPKTTNRNEHQPAWKNCTRVVRYIVYLNLKDSYSSNKIAIVNATRNRNSMSAAMLIKYMHDTPGFTVACFKLEFS